MDEAHYQQQNQTDLRSRPHSAETITSVTPITLNVAATMTDNNSDETGNKSHKDDTSPQRTAIITPTERVQLQHQTVSLSSIMNMTHNNHDKPVELTVKNNHSTIQQVTPSQSKSFMSTDVHNLVMKSLSENNVNKFLGFTIPNKDTEHGEGKSLI
ncbi:unnamed protein product [Didymodactylos carnosus]|uniref:Uncharacterized protein n=1 Tax=Didymodactylos carnosus TaxID=1234261 RepID=A0A8S2XMS1_9BILA|nr:unnamed protein product [Didymodactylos carnosus]